MPSPKKKSPAKPAAKAKPTAKAAPKPAQRKKPDMPSLFRINIEVGNLDKAADFYGTLFGTEGRKQAGSRVYFTAGAVTLQIVEVQAGHKPHIAAKALYFLVGDLDAAFERAKTLRCLSRDEVHGQPAGLAIVRPWGERSFYADDPWHNPLCFVESGTTYPG